MTELIVAEPDPRSRMIGVFLLLVGGLLVGFAAIGLRLSVIGGLGPQTTAFWRFGLALPMILSVFLVRGKLPSKPSIFAILTGFAFGMDISIWHLSLTMTSVANSTFIVNMGSLFVGFLAWIVLKDRPSVFWGGAVILALIGVYFLSTGKTGTSGSGNIRGDLVALIASCFLSSYFLFGKIARNTMSALDVLFWATLTMCIVAGVMCFFFGEPILPPEPQQLSWPLAIAFFSHFLGQGCIIAGLGRAPAAIAGVMVIVQPVASAIISWPVFGEELALLQLFGAGLILSALLVAQIPSKRR